MHIAIECPYCRHPLHVKDAKAGRYQPKCSKCARRFALLVPTDEDGQPEVRALPDAAQTMASSARPATDQTMGPAAQTLAAPGDLSAARQLGAKPTRVATEPSERPAAASSATDATLPLAPRASAVAGGAASPAEADATLAGPASPAPSGSAPAAGAAAAETIGGGPHPAAADDLDATLPPAPAAPGTIAGVDATLAGPPVRSPTPRDQTVQGQLEATQAGGPARPAASVSSHGPRSLGDLASGAVLGGYRIMKELGRGAMGAVYLARQLSLDRQVALKVIQAQWASNPTFVARFVREAYAAAQLTHHNVVQIYDLSSAGDTNFFSMEFILGQSLGDVLEQRGKLPPAEAIGYVIQAARGLDFAHRHGMIHRDIKPANLLLSDEGVVKVADLGLVKTPQSLEVEPEAGAPSVGGVSLSEARADVTIANMAMGTPAYMSPEQAENAAGVDHRADIYSLGCTLYALLTGQPPFQGATALEVMTKHKTAPVVRPDAIVQGLPPELSEIVLRMVAKDPAQRYQVLGEVIADLERFLNASPSGPPALGDEHLQRLQHAVTEFQAAPAARLRGLAATAFFGVCAVAAVALVLFNWRLAGGVVGLAVMTAAAYFVLSGIRRDAPLWRRFRELLWNSRLSDWATWVIGGLLFILLLWLLGCLWIWLGAAVVAVGLAWVFHAVVDQRVSRERQGALDGVTDMLRSLRLQGVAEESLRDFVARYSGDGWEEFYEALFGYEAKLAARQQRSEDPNAKRTPRFRGWRDPLAATLESRLQQIRVAREQRHLQKIEQRALQAQGFDAAAAQAQAERLANAWVDQAAAARLDAHQATSEPIDPKVAAAQKRERIKRMLAEARSEAKPPRRSWGRILTLGPVGFALSGKVRFLLGCLLLAGCALWAQQNQLLTGAGERLRSVAADAQSTDIRSLAGGLQSGAEFQATPLRLPLVGQWFTSLAPGVAGAMLVFLAFFRGWKMSLFALPAAAVMLFGPSCGLPSVASLGGPAGSAIVIGLAIAGAGLLFGRQSGE